MKNFIKILLISIGFFTINASDSTINPFPTQDQYAPKEIDQGELRDLLRSDDFKHALKEFVPEGMVDDFNLSPEEEEEIIQQTLDFSEKMARLTPDEQATELEKMFKQLPPPPKAAAPEAPKPIAQPKPIPKQEPIKPIKRENKLEIADTKKLIEKLVKSLEDVEIKFGSLPRVTADILLEQKWIEVREELPLTISMLKRISKKTQLTEKLASQEFSLLRSQIKDLQKDLYPQRKKLAIQDTLITKTLDDEDLSRADIPTSSQKRDSKRAVISIIKMLSRSVQNINYGNKKLFEKYDPEELKKINAEIKKSDPYQGSQYTSSNRGPGYTPSYEGSSYRPSPYQRGRYSASPSSARTSRRGQGRGIDSPGKQSSKTSQGKTDDKTKKGTTAKSDSKKTNAKETKKKIDNKQEQAFNEVKKHIDEIDEKIKELLDNQFENTLHDFATLDPTNNEDTREKIDTIRRDVQELIAPLVNLEGKISRFDNIIKKSTPEAKDTAKKQFKKHLHDKKNIKKFIDLAQKSTAPTALQTIANSLGATDKKEVLTYLQQFLQKYNEVGDKLRTFDKFKNKLRKLNDKINQLVTQNQLLAKIRPAEGVIISTETKQQLTETFKELDAYLKMTKKVEDGYGKKEVRALDGAAKQFVDILDNEATPASLSSYKDQAARLKHALNL
jgi:hypothetical protein